MQPYLIPARKEKMKSSAHHTQKNLFRIIVLLAAAAVVFSGTAYAQSINPSGAAFSASGGTGGFTVNDPATGWSAASSVSWISGISPASASSGLTNVVYSVDANTGSARTGSIIVTFGGGVTVLTFTVSQSGPDGTGDGSDPTYCHFTLFYPPYTIDNATSAPLYRLFPAEGGTGEINVHTNRVYCIWSAYTKQCPWITVTSGAEDTTGDGTVTYEVAPNEGDSMRVAKIYVSQTGFEIFQAAPPPTTTTTTVPETTTTIEETTTTTIEETTTTTVEVTTTTTTAIIIRTLEELQMIGNDPGYPLSGAYELGNGIDAGPTKSWNSGKGFKPLGTTGSKFSGTFDGKGHPIINLYINRPDEDYVGLFGSVEGTIKNVALDNVTIRGRENVGGLTGENIGGTITTCYTSGKVTGTSWVGGFVGATTRGYIAYCYSLASAEGLNFVGGFVGSAFGRVYRCYSTGAVSSIAVVGGFAGTHNTNSVLNCYWDKETSGLYTSAGGLGLTTEQCKHATNYYYWDFQNTWIMFEGDTRPMLRMEHGTAIRTPHQLQLIAMDMTAQYTLENDIDLIVTETKADIWGAGDAGFVPIELFSGSLEGKGHTVYNLLINRPDQGIIGFFRTMGQGAVICNTGFENISVSGKYTVGGIAGMVNRAAIIRFCHTTGEIISSDGNTGGIAGACQGRILFSYSTCSVRSIDGSWLFEGDGGLVGSLQLGGPYYNQDSPDPKSTSPDAAAIIGCYSTGPVTGGNMDVGGLVGTVLGQGHIIYSYSTGEVQGELGVGGLIGDDRGSWVEESYCTGKVTGNEGTGGLIGTTGHFGVCFFGGCMKLYVPAAWNSWWDTETTGLQNDMSSCDSCRYFASGAATAELKTIKTYQNRKFVWRAFHSPAWDFENIWCIRENETYPYMLYVHFDPEGASWPAAGGEGSMRITAADPYDSDCPWSLTSSASWITVPEGGQNFTGDAEIIYRVDANNGQARTGAITARGGLFSFTVTQDESCKYEIEPQEAWFPSSGGKGSVKVITDSTCPSWTAVTDGGDVYITSETTGTGSGTVEYSVDHGPKYFPHEHTLTIAGKKFTVHQTGR